LESPVLEINNLSKSYGGLQALDQFSLKISQGEICGILGPNGSGKTTTLGILLDIIKADRGEFYWFGQRPTDVLRRRVGALLEAPIFYPYLSGEKNLQIVADIKGCGYDQIDALIDLVGLSSRKKSKFKTYSLGMKQRLAIASALMGDPEVLILDEPTNGLDPNGIAEIRNLIIEIGKKGVTILLASHLLDEVQKVCTHVVILDKGKKLGDGNVNQVLNAAPSVELAADNMKQLRNSLENMVWFSEIREENGIFIATLKEEIMPGDLNKYLVNDGIYLNHLSMRKQSLEKYFFNLLSGNHD
jgi:ABC-2 type transport system ATP-binding protein